MRGMRGWVAILGFLLLAIGLFCQERGTGQEKAASTVPVVTLTQFQQAMQLSHLATEKGLPTLALRAVGDALAGGPPIQVQAAGDGRRMAKPAGVFATGADGFQVFDAVEAQVSYLESAWRAKKFPPDQVYATLAEVVLPTARPAEIFTYPQPFALGDAQQPRSIGQMLVRWAVMANQAADLRRRVEARQDQPLAQLPSRVLLAQLGHATKDRQVIQASLAWLAERVAKESVPYSGELAAHAAWPLLKDAEHADGALQVLEVSLKAITTMTAPPSGVVAGNLRIGLARFHFDNKRTAEGKKYLQEYLQSFQDVSLRYGGDHGIYQRKLHLQRVAYEYARAGELTDALDLMGQFVDLPRYSSGDPPVGGVVRLLVQHLAAKPASERHDLLKAWTLPTGNRKSVRLLATFVPQDGPPKGIGTTPRLRTPGLANTLDLLLDAAEEVNKREELVRELRTLAEQKVENARPLLIATLVATGQADEAEPFARAHLAERRQERQRLLEEQRSGRYQQQSLIDPADYVAAKACLLARGPLRDVGAELGGDLIEESKRLHQHVFLGHLRRDLALARSREHGIELVPGENPGLELWMPTAREPAAAHQAGSLPAWWIEHDGFVCLHPGRDWNFLYFKYPLMGKFTFGVDCHVGDWAEGCVGYGGLGFDVLFGSQNHSIWSVAAPDRRSRPNTFRREDVYNRVTIEVEESKFRVLVNGRAFHEETRPWSTSPFLNVYSTRGRQTAFRNFTLTGTPTIPREVSLVHEDSMEGWNAGFYGETTPPRFGGKRQRQEGYYQTVPIQVGGVQGIASPLDEVNPEDYDWHARNGVLVGKRGEPSATGQPLQSRIYYHRPLLDGESITYEFWYEPEATQVYPALDRLAFLIEPDGVRLHWMTDGDEHDWTGLKADNVVDDPAMCRGPARPPLKVGEWNSVKVAVASGVVRIELNGTLIAERAVEAENQRTFGFFRYRDRTAARVRNVVLRGDWPTSLTPGQLANLLERRQPTPPAAQRRAEYATIDESIFARATLDLLRRVRQLAPAERCKLLQDWVLPNERRAAWRFHADFTPTDPAPPVAAEMGLVAPELPRSHVGGELVSPVLALVGAAREAGKLPELLKSVREAPAEGGHAQRCQLAMLALVEGGLGNASAAQAHLEQLLVRLRQLPESTPEIQHWPEILAAAGLIDARELLPKATQLLEFVVREQIQKPKTTMPRRPTWERHVRHLWDRTRVRAHKSTQAFGVDPWLRYWSPVTHATAASRGMGDPIPDWRVVAGELHHHVGHANDHLYLNVPLRGDFEVRCELASFDGRETRIGYGGMRFALHHELKQAQLETVDFTLRSLTLQPPLDPLPDWYPFRLVVKDGWCRVHVGERMLCEERLPPEPDPWLTMHSPPGKAGGVRKLAILGQPAIPGELKLAHGFDLSGWLGGYHQNATRGENAHWTKRGDEITGRWQRVVVYDDGVPVEDPTVQQESLLKHQEAILQYHRPLLEDGVIEYEFHYDPRNTHVHPALDRLVFLLETDGVRVHWLTDGIYDRTGLQPDNVVDEPENRRGLLPLPLRAKQWNKLKLELAGNVATLHLNDVAIYQRPLEATNQRMFGFFHYADRSGVRVRNVTYQGQWPNALPTQGELLGRKPSP